MVLRAFPRVKICLRLLPKLAGGVSVSAIMKFTALAPFLLFCFAAPLSHAQSERPTIRIIPESQAPAETDTPAQTETETAADSALEGVLETGPDYSALTPKAERKVRLDDLFIRLKAETDPETAKLISEEIWALWLDSGSDTVNMILLRGTEFEKRSAPKKARRMYDHATALMPEYSEGWSRSARLAYAEEDYSRALEDSARALIIEPREFYALWTMGKVLEKLGRTDEAYKIYSEALDLYPENPAIKDRVKSLRSKVDGDVL